MKPYVTAHSVANEVRMMRTQHRGALLIVEGPLDKRVYGNLVDPDQCRIVIAHGRANLFEALQILEDDEFPRVLAIADSDFNRLGGLPSPSANALLTDLHDLECMMAASPALGKVLGEFGVPERVAAFERHFGCSIAEALVKSAATIGYLRWLSLRESLGLNFEEVTFSRFLRRDDLQVDVQSLLKTIMDHSKKHQLDNSWMLSELDALKNPSHDCWELACGHDILEILSFGLRRTLAARRAAEVGRESLERSLRLAYETRYFVKTGLYELIRAWERANQPYRVLPSGL